MYNLNENEFLKISQFAQERADYVRSRLSKSCYIKFNQEELDLICAIIKQSLQPVYFKNLLQDLDNSKKQVVRVELVLVDK